MTKSRKVLIASLLGSLFFFACENEPSGPKDLRDKYVGKYQVHESISSYGISDVCGVPYHRERDTVIIVNFGDSDTTLFVLGREVWLDSSGFYYDYHYGLTMRDDSIWSFFMNGGLGCGHYESHVGVRISPDTD